MNYIPRKYTMKKIATTFVASLTLAFACPIFAADEQKMTTETQQQAGASLSQSAEDIKGFQVFSQTGEDIGEISEVRTDKRSGEVQFVTLTKGGVGIGGKDIAIPLGAFKLDREKERATLTVSEAMLENAPTQATKSDQDFQRELSSHYGIAPVWGEGLKTGKTQKDHSRKSVVPNPVPGLETGSPHIRNKIE
jgi:hypothetical protein